MNKHFVPKATNFCVCPTFDHAHIQIRYSLFLKARYENQVTLMKFSPVILKFHKVRNQIWQSHEEQGYIWHSQQVAEISIQI